MASHRCPMCGAAVPDEVPSCGALFEEVLAREYSDPASGAVHLLTVDAYALQHPEEHGPRSNAFHLLRLCRLLEFGEGSGIGRRPPRRVGKAFEGRYRAFPSLEPPTARGTLTIADVRGARDPDEHPARVRAWAHSVWEAYRDHQEWARPGEPRAGGRAGIDNDRIRREDPGDCKKNGEPRQYPLSATQPKFTVESRPHQCKHPQAGGPGFDGDD